MNFLSYKTNITVKFYCCQVDSLKKTYSTLSDFYLVANEKAKNKPSMLSSTFYI